MNANRKRMRTEEKKQGRRRVLLALYLLLGMELLAVALTSPLLAVRNVTLSGIQTLSAEEAVLVTRLTTLPDGTNWLRAPIVAVERNLKSKPYVRSARIRRGWPGTIQAELQVREPRLIARINGVRYEVDDESVPIRPARPEVAGSLPQVELARSRPLRLGSPQNDPTLQECLSITRTLRNAPMVRIAKIEVDQSDNLCLNMHDGVRIKLGQAEDTGAKLAILQRVYTRERNVAQQMTAINLSCPEAPAYTPSVPQ